MVPITAMMTAALLGVKMVVAKDTSMVYLRVSSMVDVWAVLLGIY